MKLAKIGGVNIKKAITEFVKIKILKTINIDISRNSLNLMVQIMIKLEMIIQKNKCYNLKVIEKFFLASSIY